MSDERSGSRKGLLHRIRRLRSYRLLHLGYVEWRARRGLPDWWAWLKGHAGPLRSGAPNGGGRRAEAVLVATGAGGHLPSMTVESLLGVALAMRGARADFLLCDRALPACMMCEFNWYADVEAFAARGPVDRCRVCFTPARDMLASAGLTHLGLGEFLTADERERAAALAATTAYTDLAGFVLEGVPVGEHAVAGALRFFARGDFTEQPHAEAVVRRYFEAAVQACFATRRLLEQGRYGVVVLNHGIYVPQGVIAETARRMGVRVVTWHPAYRRECFIFNHDETYHHGLLTEPVSAWEGMQWGEVQRQQIEDYLRSRWVGSGDWVKFHTDPLFDAETIQRTTGVDFSRPTIGLLTNVVWDAQLHYRANAFPSMLDWLLETVAHFAQRPDLQLLIRVHPAEITGTVPSRQRVVDILQAAFPRLPPNVFIIPPESRLSTYTAMERCKAVIIYGTKMGVELAPLGIPVIVAGEAWIRGKGLTHDAGSREEYFSLLDKLPYGYVVDALVREKALMYAYHFFFRRMIPLACIKQKKGWPPFKVSINTLADIEPGRSTGLDVVCRGILEGTSFVYPAEHSGELHG